MTRGEQLDLFAGPPAGPAVEAPAPSLASPFDDPVATFHDAPPQDLGATVLATVRDWAERGWLRRLDAALVGFVAECVPSAGGPLLLATALVAHLEGQGHTCLVVADLLRDPAATLRWSGDAEEALRRLLAWMPPLAAGWADALSASGAVHVDATPPSAAWSDRGGSEPLVLSAGRLYLRRYWRHERRVAAAVRARAAIVEAVDAAAVRPWLDRLFGPPRRDPADDGPDWQKVACVLALRGRLALVTGGPGTGKTFTAARLLVLLDATSAQPGPRIALAAPTGKAAARLRQSIDDAFAVLAAQLGPGGTIEALAARLGPARTLHALLGTRPGTRRFRHDAAHPLDVDVVVVDEASMIHVEMMDALLSALPPGARLLLLGDKDQLASVEAGAVLGELCRDADRGRYDRATARDVEAVTGDAIPAALRDDDGPALSQHTAMLRQSQRFDVEIAALARAVNAGDADVAAALLTARSDGAVAWTVAPSTAAAVDVAVHGRRGFAGGYDRYLDLVQRGPADASDDAAATWVRAVLAAFDTVRVLCAVREGEWGVAGLNRAIVERLSALRLVAPRGEWYAGRPILVTRNDASLGVYNGDIGIALRLPGGDDRADGAAGLRVWFADGAGVRSLGVGRLGPVDTAFALTVHKSQGSEFGHTVLVLPPDANPVTTRELAYTGITRARSAFTLVTSRREALAETLAQTTQRASGLLGFLVEGGAAG